VPVAVGDVVPEFSLASDFGEFKSLSELVADGPKLFNYYVWAFTGDSTSGCDMQMCSFDARSDAFAESGVSVIGVSHDQPAAQAAFRKQIGVSYPFMSDYNWEMAKVLGLYLEDFAGLRPLNLRGAHLIDSDRVLRYAFVGADPTVVPSAAEALAAVRSA
jgi:peroxiredoxin Q/BCP